MEKLAPGDEIVNDDQQAVEQVYMYIANQLAVHKQHPDTVKESLVQQGMEAATAETLVDTINNQIKKAKREKAAKNMFFGALWCVGGIIATASDIGAIFWGAIVFGAIQFFQGVADL